MTAQHALLVNKLKVVLVKGNRTFDNLSAPQRTKLLTLALVFSSAPTVTKEALMHAVAPDAKASSQATTLKRLQELVAAFAKDARLLMRLSLLADGTAKLEALPEPNPLEQLAQAVLPLDIRDLPPPRVAKEALWHVFVSLAHEEDPKKDAEQMALVKKIETRTKLLARQQGLRDVSFFFDPQIQGADLGLQDRVVAELGRSDLYLVLLWQRYMERQSEAKPGTNLIRDLEYPHIKDRLHLGVVAAYGSLGGLDGIREALFGDKLIVGYSNPYRLARGAKKEAFIHDTAKAIIDLIGRMPPSPGVGDTSNATVDAVGKAKSGVFNTAKKRFGDDEARRLAGHAFHGLPDECAPPGARRTSLRHDEEPTPDDGTELLPKLHRWATDKKASPFCAVVGETGQGKTTAMQMFAHELLEARNKKHTAEVPLPMYIDLRRYPYDAGDTIETLLKRVLSASSQVGEQVDDDTIGQVLNALHQGELLIIFDGLDERTTGMTRQEAVHFIQQLWRIFPPHALLAWRDYFSRMTRWRARRSENGRGAEASGHARTEDLEPPQPPPTMGKMLLTCRSHYFRTFAEMNGMLLDNLRGDTQAEDFSVYRLLPFNEAQIRRFLAVKLPTRDPDEVLALFCRVHNLRELAERPLLLRLITERIDRIELVVAQSGRAFLTLHLYRDMVADWLTRDDPKHQFSTEYKPLLMESLACEFFKKRRRTLSADKLTEWLDRFLLSHPYIDSAHRNIDRELLREDLRTATFIVHGVGQDERQANAQPPRSDQGSTYAFAHTSFLEYFLACAIGRQLVQGTLDDALFAAVQPSRETAQFLAEWRASADDDDAHAFDSHLSKQLAQHAPRINAWLFQVYQHVHALGVSLVPAPKKLCLRDAKLSECSIKGVPHRWLDLRGADFSNATLTASEWAYVDARGGAFNAARLGNASFEAVHLPDRILEEAAVAACVRQRQPTRVLSNLAPNPFNSQVSPLFLEGRLGAIGSAAFDPSGQRIVSVSSDSTLKVWDSHSGECLITLQGHENWVNSAAFDPSGQRVVSASDDNTLKVWNSHSGECLITLQGHASWVRSAAFDPSGQRIVSASSDNTLKVWDSHSGECLITLQGHENWVNSAAFDPSGQRVVSASDDNTLKVWNSHSGECLITLQGHASWVRSAAFDPSGQRIVSASDDNTLKVWDSHSGECLITLQGHQTSVNSAAFDPSGQRIVSASDDNTLKVWDSHSGECNRTWTMLLPAHWACVDELQGRFIAVSSEAWRYIAYQDESERRWPVEVIGPIAGMTWPVDLQVPM